MPAQTPARSRRHPKSNEQERTVPSNTSSRRQRRSDSNSTSQWCTPARARAPSLAVLAMLATFCADSVVAVHPVTYRCPNFLCPYLASDKNVHLFTPSSPPPSPPPSSKAISKRKFNLGRRSLPNRKDPQKLPTKYLKGDDGRFRPESSWSLHGQTLTCEWATPSPSAVDEMDNVDTPVSPADVGLPQNSTLPNASSSYTQPPDDLPSGWVDSSPRSGFYQVPVIIVFALTLTLFITVLIASCALLRRKRRSKRLSRNQKEVSSELEQGLDDVDTFLPVKRSRKPKRIWIRTTARWRSGTQLACRRRRLGSSNHPSAASIASPENQHGPGPSAEVIEQPVMEEITTTRQASLPPAYLSRSTEPASTEPDNQQENEEAETQQPKPNSSSESPEPSTERSTSQPSTSMYGAHLAIDDKAVLQRIANSASSPQASDIVALSPQAPEWTDNIVEECISPDLSAPHFPLPGSVIEPTAPSVYDGSDELVPIELTPSSPMLEYPPTTEVPSAPPVDD